MSIQSLINGPFGVGAIITIGKIIPPAIGYPLAEKIALRLNKNKDSDMMRAARANQWVISGKTLTSSELDQRMRQTLIDASHWLYDFYHNMHNYKNIIERVALTKRLIEILDERKHADEGTILVVPHLSNFDFAGRAMALHGYQVQVLSYPQPHGGYRWQNKLRKDIGIDITPISTETLRSAKARLKKGGMIVTGLDRPLQKSNYHPKFFGIPAALPVSYVRLALQTHSAVMVVACVGLPQRNYQVICSEPVTMQPFPDPVVEIETNAEKLLSSAEDIIRAHPTQWAMFYPVWPSILEEIP